MNKSRKNRLILICASVMFSSFLAVACKGSESYTVTFQTDGGSAVESLTVEGGGKIEMQTTTKDEYEGTYYVFSGWYYGEETWDFEKDTVQGDMTLTAKWEAHTRTYSIKFYDENGIELETQDLRYGEPIVPPNVPEKENIDGVEYGFKGWNGLVDTVVADAEIYATYARLYEVVFENAERKTEKILEGNSIYKLRSPQREGYKFKCWILNGAPFDLSTEIFSDTTLVARWYALGENGEKIDYIELGNNLTVESSYNDLIDYLNGQDRYYSDYEKSHGYGAPLETVLALKKKYAGKKVSVSGVMTGYNENKAENLNTEYVPSQQAIVKQAGEYGIFALPTINYSLYIQTKMLLRFGGGNSEYHFEAYGQEISVGDNTLLWYFLEVHTTKEGCFLYIYDANSSADEAARLKLPDNVAHGQAPLEFTVKAENWDWMKITQDGFNETDNILSILK